MSIAPVLIDGHWQPSAGKESFQSMNPATGAALDERFPVSTWADCELVLSAAAKAAAALRALGPEPIAAFLEDYANRIDAAAAELTAIANIETALPVEPRLAKAELPRTSNQLRQAAAAVRSGSWAMPTIDTKLNIRSCFEPLGPVCVFGPNNFPFAFNSVSGGDFAAAIAAGNPVIGKANTSHPATTRKLAELALEAIQATGLPPATLQLIYRLSHEDGAKLVSDSRVGATGYTGSRHAGLALKAAADQAGKPIYLELSSVNPVVILPGALSERGAELVDEFVGSALMGTGQFCTNPGLVLLMAGSATDAFIHGVSEKYKTAAAGTLLSSGVRNSLTKAIETLTKAGAKLQAGGTPIEGRCSVSNTLLTASASQFLSDPHVFQTEAFGNATLMVVANTQGETVQVLQALEGNLTGCIYSAKSGADDATYYKIAPELACKVGRMLNDKMPTGVAVSSAMNHGGPYPATGHPGFTAVGIPASLIRFGKLTCYDNVRESRLPKLLRDASPSPETWRLIDGQWQK
ncbi:MAG: aldehyde dehydrogenase (NADP(+)) [Pirellulaceae bacterium]|nr:aldehyde dehydrogenase (NADP(+)) [Pirellulaceae bacterium]